MNDDSFGNFPDNGLLPKKETGSLNFLQKYPEYDGRDVVIAIFDTGVDPGAAGLQMTSHSKPKIIDLIDATGDGNVDISHVVTANGSELTGLSGRKLKIPQGWKNPSGKFHLGIKDVYELCSSTLRDRLKKERKEKYWQPAHNQAVYSVQAKLNELNGQKSKSPAADAVTSSTSEQSSNEEGSKSTSSSDITDLANTLNKEDLQTQLELLKDLENKIKDVGPVYDCIVWNDGDIWRACVDTTEKGDLENCKVLTNYKDSFEYSTFSYLDMLNYSVRILPNENILQIVTDSSSHGTHVASIAAGYFPDRPELNGVAPGAQIISIKIGDTRIDGMESSYSLVNACRYVAEYKCDLVNCSFGEPVSFANFGPALTAVQELIEKYGVVFCVSAGNNGPGVETVGAPGGSVPTAVSVAAYVTNDMIRAEHSLLGNSNSMLFTWSSRGPCLDGHWGVSVCAPGGAFASVPNWTQRGTQLMSGTSMASPNCCGCISLILSGLKQNKIDYNPYMIKRAIENTAANVDEFIGTGAGLIQVERAYDYLLHYKDSLLQKLHFDVKYTVKSNTMRGIYLKNHDEVSETRDYLIAVEPKFFENKSRSHESTEASDHDQSLLNIQKEKLSLNRKLGLVVDNTEGSSHWLECPSFLYVVNGSRQFHIRIRANELEEGTFNFTHIKAIDLEDPKRSCIFKIPVTVVKPNIMDGRKNADYELEFKNVSFKQGQIYRHFIRAPHGSTHAELTLKCDQLLQQKDHSPLFYVQTFTLGNFRTLVDSVNEEVYRLNNTNEFKLLLKVQANKILQVTVCKNWSNMGHVLANYKIKFSGLYPKNSHDLCCLSSQPYKLEVGSYLRNEDCEPTIVYKRHIQPLRPTEHQIEIVRPSIGLIKPIYQIVLTYNFHQIKSEEVGCEVPLLSHLLYENEFQSIFWMVYEANSKRYIFSGDAFPTVYKYVRTLEKGDYVVKLHIRHEKIELLEKLKEIVLYVRRPISGTLSPELYLSYANLMKGTGKKTGPERIQKDTEVTYFLNVLPEDKLPKGVANGHFLAGDLTLYKDAAISKVDKHQIMYQINNYGSSAKKQAANSNNSKEKSAVKGDDASVATSTSANKADDKDNKLKEAIRDVQVSYILKSNELFETLKKEYEDHVPIYVNRAQYLEQQLANLAKTDSEKRLKYLDEIIDVSRQGLNKINQNDVLKFFGEKQHDPQTEEKKKDYENQKNWIIELLVQQGSALIEKSIMQHADIQENSDSIKYITLNEDVAQIYRSIQKWIDINDEKVSKFTLKFFMHHKYLGKSLKLLFKQLDEKNASKSVDQTVLRVLNELNLKYGHKFYTNSLILKYPPKFASY